MAFGRRGALQRMESVCKQIHEKTKEFATWSWEPVAGAAQVTVEMPHDTGVVNLFTELMPHSWNQLDIAGAPEPVRHVSALYGGLMPGQRLFVFEDESDPLLFATWWPWGDRLNFTLRVGAYSSEELVSKDELQAGLKSWFEISDEE